MKCGNKSDKDPGFEKAPNIKIVMVKTFNIFFFWVTFLHIIMINISKALYNKVEKIGKSQGSWIKN